MGFLKNALSGFNEKNERIRLGDVRRGRAIYILAYVFELLFFSARGQFTSVGGTVFGMDGYTVAMAFHGVGSHICILLWSKNNRVLRTLGIVLSVAGFLPFFFLSEGSLPRIAAACLGYFGLGFAVTGARVGYAFGLNNAERLLGILIALLGNSFIRSTPDGLLPVWLTHFTLPVSLLALMSVCLFLFRDEEIEIRETDSAEDRRGLYWALAYFLIYFALDGYYWKSLRIAENGGYGWKLLGMLIGTGVLAVFFLVLRRNSWHLWNAFFALFAVSAALAVFLKPGVLLPLRITLGGAEIFGWALSIYFYSCALRRFSSIRALKISTVVFVAATPLMTLPDNVVDRFAPNALPAASLITVALLLFGLLALAPYSWKHLFSTEWLGDLSRSDMRPLPAPQTADAPPQTDDPFEAYALTPRQREIAALLLDAKTRRQIAGELGISESTVKTHVSDLYEKLGINSRAELFRMFGVTKDV